jgi:hypothetical protein
VSGLPKLHDTPAVQTAETLWRVYAATNEWIRFADAKAGAILTAEGVLAGAAVTALQGNKPFLESHILILLLFGAALLCLLASAGFCLSCIFPSLNFGKAESLLYFAHIAEQFPQDHTAYTEQAKIVLQNPQEELNQIGQQVWANAKVATHKNQKIINALRFLLAALVLGVLGIILLMWEK